MAPGYEQFPRLSGSWSRQQMARLIWGGARKCQPVRGKVFWAQASGDAGQEWFMAKIRRFPMSGRWIRLYLLWQSNIEESYSA